jgi:uncharacterized protein YbaR (Trm112 family)
LIDRAMFIELLDLLRCPRGHEESWLVLAAQRTDDRDVMEGVLGCPVCQAEYPIVEGIARFVDAPVDTAALAPNEEDTFRLAATLDLTGSRGYAILVGAWGSHAPVLLRIVDVPLMLVNPPAGVEIGQGISGLTIEQNWTSLPLARGSSRAIALDDAATPTELASAVATLKPGGRILAPVSLALPDGVTKLASDERHWVAEATRTAMPSGVVSLTRHK